MLLLSLLRQKNVAAVPRNNNDIATITAGK